MKSKLKLLFVVTALAVASVAFAADSVEELDQDFYSFCGETPAQPCTTTYWANAKDNQVAIAEGYMGIMNSSGFTYWCMVAQSECMYLYSQYTYANALAEYCYERWLYWYSAP